MLTTLICAAQGRLSIYDNLTVSWPQYGGEERNGAEELLSEDIYMSDVGRSCIAGSLSACLERRAGSVLLDLMNSARSLADDAGTVTLVKTSLPTSKSTSKQTKRNIKQDGFLGFLMRSADRYLRSTGLVVELNDEVTESGLYRPRFIDEIYSELDKLQDKNAKPNKQHEFKRLFIPLLVILKIFKLKLLIFLPLLLGLASFKKIIALLIIIVPGIVGYLKVCKPDLGHTYGSFGHSSFYNRPPSAKRKQEYKEIMEQGYSHSAQQYAHQMAYQSHRNG